MYARFDNMLKEIDDEYRTTIINFDKYPLIMFAMVKIIKMTKEESNSITFNYKIVFTKINIILYSKYIKGKTSFSIYFLKELRL